MDSTYLANKLCQRPAGRMTWLVACLVALAGFAVISLANAPAAAAVVADDVVGSIQKGACLETPPVGKSATTTPSVACAAQTGGDGLQKVIATALNILTWITGVAAVFVLIIAGFRYVVSGGSSSGVTGAKNMIIYALIGIVIAMLAQLIVRFVIGEIGTAAKTSETAATASTTTPLGSCTNDKGTVTCVYTDGTAYPAIPVDSSPSCTPSGEGETCEFTEF